MEDAAIEGARVPSRVSARFLRWLPWVAGAVAVGLLLRFTLLRPARVPVTVFRAAAGRVEESVTNSKAGTVKSRRRAELSTEIGGRVRELPVAKGARVRTGEVLMRIADGDYRAQVDLQQQRRRGGGVGPRRGLPDGRAARPRARAQPARSRATSSSPWSSLDQLQSRRDAAAAACEAARARIGQARAALEAARVNLEKTVLRAPFDGVVAEVTTEVGEWITPSPPGLPIPPVIVLLDAGVDLRQRADGRGRRRQGAGGPAGRASRIDAFPGRSFPGRVTRVAPYVQDVAGAEPRLRDRGRARRRRASPATLPPGTSADVEVILAARDGVLRIPSSALLEGDRVLVVARRAARGPPGRARACRTGSSPRSGTGSRPGDAVVVSLDRAEVKEGARVAITAESAR